MSLENIIREVEERKKKEMSRISAEYDARKQSLESETEKEISKIKADFDHRTQEESKSIEKRELDAARMEAKKILREKATELIELNLGKSMTFLNSIREYKGYDRILKEMAETSKKALGKGCTIRVASRDAGLLGDVKGIKVVEEEIDPFGGIIAESEDGTREMNLTVTTLSREIKEAVAVELSQRIGGD